MFLPRRSHFIASLRQLRNFMTDLQTSSSTLLLQLATIISISVTPGELHISTGYMMAEKGPPPAPPYTQDIMHSPSPAGKPDPNVKLGLRIKPDHPEPVMKIEPVSKLETAEPYIKAETIIKQEEVEPSIKLELRIKQEKPEQSIKLEPCIKEEEDINGEPAIKDEPDLKPSRTLKRRASGDAEGAGRQHNSLRILSSTDYIPLNTTTTPVPPPIRVHLPPAPIQRLSAVMGQPYPHIYQFPPRPAPPPPPLPPIISTPGYAMNLARLCVKDIHRKSCRRGPDCNSRGKLHVCVQFDDNGQCPHGGAGVVHPYGVHTLRSYKMRAQRDCGKPGCYQIGAINVLYTKFSCLSFLYPDRPCHHGGPGGTYTEGHDNHNMRAGFPIDWRNGNRC